MGRVQTKIFHFYIYIVLRKGKIFLSTFVGMRRGEERQTASHWLEEKMRGKGKSKKRLLLKGTVRPFTSAQKRKNKNPNPLCHSCPNRPSSSRFSVRSEQRAM